MSGFKPVRRALLSVTDKSGLVDFATALASHGVDLVSTGGTSKALRDAGLKVSDISDLTGFPEMLDGRVKTLHPKVHGGLLHRREDPAHVAAVNEHNILPIDMVVVNLYAFEKTAAKPGVAFHEIIENIDIGGPSMLRSGAKNFEDVAVVTNVEDYTALIEELKANDGKLSLETRARLARGAFATTAAYDTAIANTLEALAKESTAPAPTLRIVSTLKNPLRYGENPHQKAALYSDGSALGIANAKQLQGKELSYNNLVDLDACWNLTSEFEECAVAIIKHTNPCGVGQGSTPVEAYLRALEADPLSAFGGVIGVNRVVDEPTAVEMAKLFVEAIVAPGFTPEALAVLAAKKNLRVLVIEPAAPSKVVKQISGGFLVQDEDHAPVTAENITVPTKRQPTPEELSTLLFAWKVCKHVKSNAIVYAREQDGFGQSVGMGAGQMSRVDAAKFGAMKAVLPLTGTVAASDAFFPFPDGLETIAKAGATAIIQPGGSVKDADVIAKADELGIAMVFTGIRHFRHG
ncbi:bifunctional phosphoribosylaminoimidazolecarboxamide formyltransferase/IMP cyclohydrolase [Granulicella paludicola]|jgi:phosphoribosylaminoimidazolecarboxamide formyltransferase/IMP cyclohydrolase|uniref:bifunctional phosphoribosylaminoimidazolecarboxamide formyltransferase/IMP cyclohydrolase n=1 Tax=Granulicella paludicola TaxID=474951 RepID=UPI0021DF9FC9|nr:bifunctional phosphoribosylaminoimidazolecarboxamide formyltransferase/IMP cyclohydrolase [Granulicella paludicola]